MRWLVVVLCLAGCESTVLVSASVYNDEAACWDRGDHEFDRRPWAAFDQRCHMDISWTFVDSEGRCVVLGSWCPEGVRKRIIRVAGLDEDASECRDLPEETCRMGDRADERS